MGIICCCDTVAIRGALTLIEFDVEQQRELSCITRRNTTVLVGKRLALELLFGQHQHFVQYLAAGDDGTPSALADQALYHERLRGPLTSVTADDDSANGLLTARYIMGTTQGNGETFREAGLFTDTNVLYARVAHDDRVKTAAKILIYQWDLVLA